jgi:hypothetical protein
MDDFERAALLEEEQRVISARNHAERDRSPPADECADCDIALEQHRREFGTCIECQSAREKRARLYRKG